MIIFRRAVQALCVCLLGASSLAQQPKPEEAPARAVISDVKLTPDGGLLFAVRLYASKTKTLNLSRKAPPRNPNVPRQQGDDDPLPFSLSGSTLRDLYADKLYTSLPMLPVAPYVGPMAITTAIYAGGWIQLGVAFPPVPPPPPDKEGKKQPYQLMFEIPELKMRTLMKLDPDTLKPIEALRKE